MSATTLRVCKSSVFVSYALHEKFPYSGFFWSVHSRILTEYLSNTVSLRIQFECGKIRTGKTPNTDTFLAVMDWGICTYFLRLELRDVAIQQVKKKKDELYEIMKIRIVQNDWISACNNSNRQPSHPQKSPIDAESYIRHLIQCSTEFSTILEKCSGTVQLLSLRDFVIC